MTDQITAEYIIHIFFVNRFQNEAVSSDSVFSSALIIYSNHNEYFYDNKYIFISLFLFYSFHFTVFHSYFYINNEAHITDCLQTIFFIYLHEFFIDLLLHHFSLHSNINSNSILTSLYTDLQSDLLFL